MPVETQLVDTGIDYCDPDDVFTHIRNKKYDDLPQDSAAATQGALTKDAVDDLISRKSDYVDTYTKRAWRTRKAVDVEVPIELSHAQKHARHRRRRHRRGIQRRGQRVSGRGFVDLPHTHIKPIDSNQSDSVVVLNPRSTTDITTDEGRDSGSYVVSNRKGVLRPDIDLLVPVGAHGSANDLTDGQYSVRVSYRYGAPYSVTDYDADSNGVSDYVPGDVRDATALLVAAQLVGSDQYGELVPNTGDDSPNLSDAASTWSSVAKSTLQEYRRR